MALSTKNPESNIPKGSVSTREKIKKLQEKHLPLFEKEGVSNPRFQPRMAYKYKGELIVGFYEREIYGGSDVYTEFVSRDYTPEDNQRRLWKWIYNPEYKTEYELSEPHDATGDRRYLIPVDELIDVEQYHNELEATRLAEDNKELNYDEPTGDEDVPYDAMTLRDYCAIQWQKPVSHRKWLNKLIRDNNFK